MKPYYEQDGITIYCGDSREWLALQSDLQHQLILTDPPYGAGIQYGEKYDDSSEAYWTWFFPILGEMRRVAKNVVFTHRQAAVRAITDWTWLAVWQKPLALGYAHKGWMNHWEPIFCFGQPDVIANGGTKPAFYDVFSYNPCPPNGHPTPKPIALMRKLASMWTGTIVDPFMGSGTTLRAAKDLGRTAIGIEIEERYCEMAAQQLSQGVLLTA